MTNKTHHKIKATSCLEVLDLLTLYSDEFKDRLSTSPRNCKYTSNTTQNITLLAACDTILSQISTESQQAGLFTIMADERRDVSRTEQFSVCVRYVNNSVITERFLGFSDMYDFGASAITDKIVSMLDSKESI